MKIAVYTVALNEEHNVDRFMASARDADIVVVGDTGSNDGTYERLHKAGASIIDIRVQPWRFDHARNTALFLLPPTDVCISLDLDEELKPGWRQHLEAAWVPGTTRLRYTYKWSPEVTFLQDKIHARFGYDWIYACHETLRPHCVERFAVAPQLEIVHHLDRTKSRKQYVGLLRTARDENPGHDRPQYYYARELLFNEQWYFAMQEFQNYLALPGAIWDQERAQAWCYIAQCHVHQVDLASAERAYMRAIAECPQRREVWCELADFYVAAENWPGALWAANQALAIKKRSDSFLTSEKAWQGWPEQILTIAKGKINE